MYIFPPLCPRVSVLAVANEQIIYNVKVIIMFTELLCFIAFSFPFLFLRAGHSWYLTSVCSMPSVCTITFAPIS